MPSDGVTKFVVEKVINWLPVIKQRFSPFKPETKQFTIEYKKRKAQIDYRLDLEDDAFRRKHQKIEIPRNQNYKIIKFMDESFSNLLPAIKIDTTANSYIIKTKTLPSCSHFLVTVEGDIDPQALDKLVYIQPARNENNTKTCDKYWLAAMIRNVSLLEKFYESVDVNEINMFVQIGIARHFNTALPDSWKNRIKAFNEFIKAGRGRSRDDLFRAWQKFRKLESINIGDIGLFFDNLVKKLSLLEYISIDDPFLCGDISSIENQSFIPSSFTVEALTKLDLKHPSANGCLEFHKEKFKEDLGKQLNGD